MRGLVLRDGTLWPRSSYKFQCPRNVRSMCHTGTGAPVYRQVGSGACLLEESISHGQSGEFAKPEWLPAAQRRARCLDGHPRASDQVSPAPRQSPIGAGDTRGRMKS